MRDLAARSARGLGLALALVASPAAPDAPAGSDPPPSVHDLMEGMAVDLEALTGALVRSDFERAASAASAIAEHPVVAPAERAAIARALGPEMADFKGYDNRVQEAARALAVAAAGRDHAAAARSHGALLGGCMGCHARYRDRARAALESR